MSSPDLPRLRRVAGSDLEHLTGFLHDVDLTLSGLDSPAVRLWIDRDDDGAITGSTGFELSEDGRHALVRSVAVHPNARRAGYGSALARFALEAAADAGVVRAWLFSRRSGPFWQTLGFEPADREELAAVLAGTHQVRLFQESGQLAREVAWSRALAGARPAPEAVAR
ncbi:GNAT family N-acetyltransferase [Myceligenerans pegani]|uniref:GNAT family N-acetyltransferase n=1 Tax=Myceligenerans pegani TaxID=2776917 RepID=A0ABR9MXD9_9MICO|nr:GNAT family N-acetyltransferase [Myceligenerans sp. TRM 65318]MBE1876047.1 GNAT family N-acetyltransferase [Myceligenerans sp. TRM 65318]MBE3018318.1 GNAT family N-acetyltransferase [Myceligenerans sp. TRM 65318]